MAAEKFKILIVDDDVDLRELLIEAVRNWDYVADVAKDGQEALLKLRMEKYDLVVCDLMMPGMDGLTLLTKIKELDKDILVIIITGYATIETAVKAIEAGAYDYIAKPFRLDELMIVIKNACERLRLTFQNKALLDELRDAYSEIAMLKDNIGGKASGATGAPAIAPVDSTPAEPVPAKAAIVEEGTVGPSEGTTGKGTQGVYRQKEYLKEADRLLKIKSQAKV
ncbi:MAG: sigma-54-dependent Fis family transcriptional regulator [Proteobacteria bacterium]|nr:sigma-54-dependent Fis family transcriptional regulator [Pseudomonadota bacterium]